MRRRAAVVVLLLALALAGCSRDQARPEGIAERWLQAVSELGRDGLREDAQERLRDYGVAAPVAVPGAEKDERTFSDLEVGKARLVEGGALVPFRVTARIEGDKRQEIRGVLALARAGDSWTVMQALPPGPEDKVPSEGGERPAHAKALHWLVTLLIGMAMTAAAVLVIERQPRPGQAALH